MALNINGTTGISGVDGSASAPALQGTDSNTGINFGSDTVNINTGGSTRATVDSSGRLLLGTTSASGISGNADDLVIGSTSDSTARGLTLASTTNANIRFADDGDNATGMIEYNHSSNFMRFYVEAGERMRIDSSGNVGIGKTPSDRLDVQTTHSSGGRIATFYNSDSGNNGGLIIQGGQNDGEARLQTAGGSSFLTFYTEGGDLAERIRITSSGHLTNTASNSMPTSGSGWGFTEDQLYLSTAGTSSNYALRFYNDNGLVGSVLVNGSGVTYNTSSDYRLKENVTAISDGITRLKTLKPSRFNFKADAKTTVDGFLAHEVSSLVPEAISGTKDEVDSNNNPVYQGIDQSKLVPLLTAALQEAIAKIETLETKVAALEAG